MEEFPGALGTSRSLALRLGQATFAVASLFFMCFDEQFRGYSAFCFLVTTLIVFVLPWSLTWAIVDGFLVFRKTLPPKFGMISVVVGDWAVSFLSLAASSSTAGIISVLIVTPGFCKGKVCARYQVSAAMAFFSWFLSMSSFLFNLWFFLSL